MTRLTDTQRADAACRGQDPDLWHPERGDNGTWARQVCRGCPIREACLTVAVERREPYGVWGGAGERDRRKLRRAWLVGGPVWTMALAEHFEALDRGATVDANGPKVTHGRRVTYARGCTCGPCSLAAVMPDGAAAKIGSAA